MPANSPRTSKVGPMARTSATEITGLLLSWRQGDKGALDALAPLVYRDLRRMAARLLRGERPEHTLQPTALVHEAYLKLFGQHQIDWQNRSHFFAVAARAMRQILVDHARGHQRVKRGAGAAAVPLDEAWVFVPERSIDLLALDRALDRLASLDARKVRVVELRFFAGLNNSEIAEVLEISPNTVMRDWRMAKAWLRRDMEHALRS